MWKLTVPVVYTFQYSVGSFTVV